VNLELNITLECNQQCNHCNRLCNLYPDRTERMTLAQVEKFIRQCRSSPLNKIKVLGGEPLLHPDFSKIYNLLVDAKKDKIISGIKVNTNGSVKRPQDIDYSQSRWLWSKPFKKGHFPFLWHPKDLGFDLGAKYNCRTIKVCGISLDKYGYLPCSPAIMIVRLFGLTHLYKRELPEGAWGLEEICQHCIFAMPQEWLAKHSFSATGKTEEDNKPSKMFQDAIDNFDYEKFYRTQEEF
jgi:hypothetical protein